MTAPEPAPGEAPAPKPWTHLDSRPGPDLLVSRVRFDRVENPRNGREFQRLVLETRDWVNVVALTPEREVVLVRQYRFGTRALSLEIPGGVVDPGEVPEAAARRELAEETGFTAPRWRPLGSVETNPAFMDNRCHHFLAEGARCTGELGLDEGEDIRVELVALERLRELVHSGEVCHSLVVTALARVLDLRVPGDPTAGGH